MSRACLAAQLEMRQFAAGVEHIESQFEAKLSPRYFCVIDQWSCRDGAQFSSVIIYNLTKKLFLNRFFTNFDLVEPIKIKTCIFLMLKNCEMLKNNFNFSFYHVYFIKFTL